MKTVIIIGGGLSGLFAGAFLSKEGYQVTVLEKNAQIGGGLQGFTRKGEIYETGMHILGGFHEGGSMRRILQYLNVWNQLKIQDFGDETTDIVQYGDGTSYELPKGREAFVAYLSEQFPAEADGIKAYVDRLYAISEEIDLFYLRPSERSIFDLSEEACMAADDLIAKYVHDECLRDVLGYLTLTYAGEAGKTPAYIHALINVLYINGTCQFIGGSQQLADLLKDIIVAAGGEVRRNEPVVAIHTEGKRIVDVKTRAKHVFTGDYFISAIHPSLLLDLLPEGSLPTAYCNRLRGFENTYSAFTAFIKFKPNTFPQLKSPVFYQDEVGMAWNRAVYDDSNWPQTYLVMTPPKRRNEVFASHMIVLVPFDYEQLKPWEDTTVRNRGEVYDKLKEEHLNRVISSLKKQYPVIEDCIVDAFAATPLTIRDYFGNERGSLYGYLKDCRHMEACQTGIHTKLQNLLLTGQSINLHGMCGTTLSALATAEAIVGKDVILNKIK